MCVRSVYYPRWVVGKAGTTTDSKQIGRPRAPHVAEIRVLVLKAHAGGFEINMGLLCQARGKLGRAAQGQTCQDLVRQALDILPRRLIDAKEQGLGTAPGVATGLGTYRRETVPGTVRENTEMEPKYAACASAGCGPGFSRIKPRQGRIWEGSHYRAGG